MNEVSQQDLLDLLETFERRSYESCTETVGVLLILLYKNTHLESPVVSRNYVVL